MACVVEAGESVSTQPGLSSLIRTMTVGDCVVIERGLDVNRNGRLDDDEVEGDASSVCSPPPVSDVEARLAALESLTIRTPIVLDVRDDAPETSTTSFVSLQAAFDYLQDKRITGPDFLTLQVSRGTYYSTQPLAITHTDSHRVLILGDEARPENVVLEFEGSNGLELERGAHLARFSGFKISRSAESTAATSGIVVRGGSNLSLGSVIVSGFRHSGILVEGGSGLTQPSRQVGSPNEPTPVDIRGCVDCSVGVRIEGSGYVLFQAFAPGGILVTDFAAHAIDVSGHSTLSATNARIDRNGGAGVRVAHSSYAYLPEVDVDGSGEEGIIAQYGAVVVGSGSITGSGSYGLRAEKGSTIVMRGVTIDESGGHGVLSDEQSFVDVYGGTVSNSAGFAFSADLGGGIRTGNSGNGNTSGANSPGVGDNSQDEAFITTSP
ncbi:MAG: right-handed parallel beta-helix repeat-containing protein [Deltaproteobacteria bacterium]